MLQSRPAPGVTLAANRFEFLIQPGWNDSPPEHWQSHWQQCLGARRVANRDWHLPSCEDWLAGLHAALAQAEKPVIVVAHSLGCIAVAHYARLYPQAIAGALLVAPADVEREDAPSALLDFAPAPHAALPFPALVLASTNDPFCRSMRAKALADSWGARLEWLEQAGHVNVASGHQKWPEGLVYLAKLVSLLGQDGEARALTARA
ncbi:alpha/beta hydrolase [Rhodobacteraceae bacterium CH30]|nr:alpha/beta hydrolase [Rhodobacteraceae bacterium CH30]